MADGVILRPARPEDQPVIRRLVREARLNLLSLRWSRFVVAEVAGKVIGAAQVQPHWDGSRELASVVVDPAWRGQGIGSRLVRTVMTRERGPLYLICRAEREAFYARLGFQVLPPEALPPRFRRLHRVLRGLRLPWRVMGWDPREV